MLLEGRLTNLTHLNNLRNQTLLVVDFVATFIGSHETQVDIVLFHSGIIIDLIHYYLSLKTIG